MINISFSSKLYEMLIKSLEYNFKLQHSFIEGAKLKYSNELLETSLERYEEKQIALKNLQTGIEFCYLDVLQNQKMRFTVAELELLVLSISLLLQFYIVEKFSNTFLIDEMNNFINKNLLLIEKY